MKELKFTRRYTTDVAYEYEEYTVAAQIDEDDDVVATLNKIKADVELAHSEAAPLVEAGPDEEETVEETPPVKASKKSKAKPTTAPIKEEEDAEEEETVDEDSGEEEEEEEKPVAKKKFKKSGSVYQRTNEIHKKLVAEQLFKIAPKWKSSDASKAKAMKLSKALEGEDFLDADGAVVPSFIAALKKGMK